MSEQPLVSAIIILFNGENFLQEAIESVLSQTYAHLELLLVNDGSSDGSSAIAQSYAEVDPSRIRYVDHPGPLDHDDIWLPRKLEEQVAILEARSDVGMVSSRPSRQDLRGFWIRSNNVPPRRDSRPTGDA